MRPKKHFRYIFVYFLYFWTLTTIIFSSSWTCLKEHSKLCIKHCMESCIASIWNFSFTFYCNVFLNSLTWNNTDRLYLKVQCEKFCNAPSLTFPLQSLPVNYGCLRTLKRMPLKTSMPGSPSSYEVPTNIHLFNPWDCMTLSHRRSRQPVLQYF